MKGPVSRSEARRLEITNPGKLSEQYCDLRREYDSLVKENKNLKARLTEPSKEMRDSELVEYLKSEAKRLCPKKQIARLEVWSLEARESYKVTEKYSDFIARMES